MTAHLPARILLQIREGVLNELASFDLPVEETRPTAVDDPGYAKGARLDHKTNLGELLTALAVAQHKVVGEIRKAGHEVSAEWMHKLTDWVLEP